MATRDPKPLRHRRHSRGGGGLFLLAGVVLLSMRRAVTVVSPLLSAGAVTFRLAIATSPMSLFPSSLLWHLNMSAAASAPKPS